MSFKKPLLLTLKPTFYPYVVKCLSEFLHCFLKRLVCNEKLIDQLTTKNTANMYYYIFMQKVNLTISLNLPDSVNLHVFLTVITFVLHF